MKRKIIIGIIGLILIAGAFVACSDSDSSSENAVDTQSENSADTQEEESLVIFDKNEVVNDFFVNYQELSNTEFTKLHSSRNYNCYAENDGYYFEVRDLSDKIQVIVDQTTETSEKGIEGMRDVYYYTVKTLDNTLSDDEIYSVFDSLGEHRSEETIGSLSITIYPDMELSNGYDPGHIDISKSK